MTTPGSSHPPARGIREIGGEIWAELAAIPDSQLRWDVKNTVVDIVMGVLARHVGSIVENDSDLPVTPLPPHSNDQ